MLRWFYNVFTFPAALVALLTATVFFFMRKGLADPDIWWHLNNARHLFTTGHLLTTDLYSFTARGLPWTNPEYLGEIPYYLGWRAFGLVGVKVVSILFVETIYLGLFYLCWQESKNVKAAAVAGYFAVFLGSVTFGPRTILPGYCFLVLLLIVLQRYRLRGKAPLWILPPLFCLWINTHGSWSLGFVVFGIVVASGLVDGQWGMVEATRWSPRQLRNLLLTFAASIGAVFINPYGYRLTLYPLDMAIRQRVDVEHVAEWVSVDFHDARGKVVMILIVVLLLAALMSGHRWKLHELGLVLFGLYSGLTYIRFLLLAAILIAPLLARFLDFIPPYQPEIDKPVLNALIVAGAVFFMVRAFPSAAQLQQSIDVDYPTEFLGYLKAHPPDGPVMNSYLWGGYLCWNNPEFKDFIDSRGDIFVYTGVFQDYINLLSLTNPNAILDKYGIRYVLLPNTEALSYLLERDAHWIIVYRGKTSLLFERVGTTPAPTYQRISAAAALAW